MRGVSGFLLNTCRANCEKSYWECFWQGFQGLYCVQSVSAIDWANTRAGTWLIWIKTFLCNHLPNCKNCVAGKTLPTAYNVLYTWKQSTIYITRRQRWCQLSFLRATSASRQILLLWEVHTIASFKSSCSSATSSSSSGVQHWSLPPPHARVA